jgi:dihydropteroate synthase
MGIVNATPDSFYPGSRGGIEHGLRLLKEGADWLDVGGQSTRPGSEPVSLQEELDRVVPLVERFSKECRVSIDTDKAAVAKAAREAGAAILNDITALRGDPAMAVEAVQFEDVILMHMQGTPKTMQQDPRYADVVREVKDFLAERLIAFTKAGGDAARVMVDPGIGFGKALDHNLSLLKHVAELKALAPVVLGVSRKSFLSKITPDEGPEQRLEGSLACAVLAAQAGVKVLRVHDAAATRRALDLVAAVQGAA